MIFENTTKEIEKFFAEDPAWRDMRLFLLGQLTMARSDLEELNVDDCTGGEAYSLKMERTLGLIDALKKMVNDLPEEMIESSKQDEEKDGTADG